MAEARRNVPYVEVTVQPDETLTDIATERLGGFNDSILKQIETLNPRLADNPDHIETGQKLRLPTPAAAPVSSRED